MPDGMSVRAHWAGTLDLVVRNELRRASDRKVQRHD
jgi:hypothetical protein